MDRLDLTVPAATEALAEDYPLGRRARGKAKWWLEEKPGHGVRLVRQTENVRRGGWNKPHTSTYRGPGQARIRFGRLESGKVARVEIGYSPNGRGEKVALTIGVADGAGNHIEGFDFQFVEQNHDGTTPERALELLAWLDPDRKFYTVVPRAECRACKGKGFTEHEWTVNGTSETNRTDCSYCAAA